MVNVLVTDSLIAGYLDEPSWEVLTGRPEAEIVARLPEADVLVAYRLGAGRAPGQSLVDPERLGQLPAHRLYRVQRGMVRKTASSLRKG